MAKQFASIKISNKLIKKLGKKIEKYIKKIKEKEDIIRFSQDQLKAYQAMKNQLLKINCSSWKNLNAICVAQSKAIKKIEVEVGLPQALMFKYYQSIDDWPNQR